MPFHALDTSDGWIRQQLERRRGEVKIVADAAVALVSDGNRDVLALICMSALMIARPRREGKYPYTSL